MKRKQTELDVLTKKLKKHKRAAYLQFFFSAISLIVVIAVFITSSSAWFTIKTSKFEAASFTLECGKGLRVNDSGTSDFSYKDVQRYISPASSVTGRNLFYPADGSDFSTDTDKMTFRSATVGDKNENYIQIDFTLTAQANNTALYINEKETEMYLAWGNNSNTSNTLAAPLRMAIWSSTAANGYPNTPVVFNPTSESYYTAAVSSVDRASGKLLSKDRQLSHTFSDYAYGGTPVAILSKGVQTKFSIIIWLEGADPKCKYSKVNSKDIGLKLAFTTSWDRTQVIRFKDDTTNNWVSGLMNDGYSLALHYEDYDTNTSNSGDHEVTDFNMYTYAQSENEWFCNMPGDMTNKISFVLTPGTDSTDQKTYKFTYDSKNPGSTSYNREFSRQYVAKLGPYTSGNYETCQGYWVELGDSDGGGHDDNDFDGDDF